MLSTIISAALPTIMGILVPKVKSAIVVSKPVLVGEDATLQQETIVVEKPWYKSKGVVGGVAVIGLSIANLWLGLDLTTADAQSIMANADNIVMLMFGIMSVVGRKLAVK